MIGNDPPAGGAQQVVAIYLRSDEASAAADRLAQKIPTSGMAIVCRPERPAASGPILPVRRLVVLGATVAGAVIGAVSGVLVQVWELDAPLVLPLPVAVGAVFGAVAAPLVAVLCCAVAAPPRAPMRIGGAARYYEVRVGAAFADRAVRILHGSVATAPDEPAATT
ncbi:hypothetical protein [Actinoplanes auranticolor]|uniref:Uncharacterized protein n=1 Tax=Actinoplanes auranticolor TaxID=47988 RepID=A0A919VQN1_9ACTN|nr:hypothetical protein [Actinoplanes auranticolor]GIM71995.1 hypothetical protein Aau02nite_48750 [Actinoplanes auranticolor]